MEENRIEAAPDSDESSAVAVDDGELLGMLNPNDAGSSDPDGMALA